MIERLVWLDDSGFHVRDAKGKFHLHLSPERAKPLTTKAERAIAQHRYEATKYDLPTFDGENYVWDGEEWPADDILDDLESVWGFTRDQGELILETSRLMFKLGCTE